jgi:hypothetical protein
MVFGEAILKTLKLLEMAKPEHPEMAMDTVEACIFLKNC